MRNILIILFLGLSANSFGQKRTWKDSDFIKKFLITYNLVQKFDLLFEKSGTEKMVDSIKKYNRILTSMFLSSEFGLLTDSDLSEISKLTDVNICNSQDKRLKVISWCVFLSQPNPTCSSIVFYNGNLAKKISINQNDDGDFGNNVQNDTVIDFLFKGNVYYVLFGVNKCGNLCIQKMASIYSVLNGSIVKCLRAFYDGKDYLDDAEFNYVLNDEIRNEPSFRIEKRELVCPVFNDRRTKQIGEKRYKILFDKRR
jgi:hypothetical protein